MEPARMVLSRSMFMDYNKYLFRSCEVLSFSGSLGLLYQKDSWSCYAPEKCIEVFLHQKRAWKFWRKNKSRLVSSFDLLFTISVVVVVRTILEGKWFCFGLVEVPSQDHLWEARQLIAEKSPRSCCFPKMIIQKFGICFWSFGEKTNWIFVEQELYILALLHFQSCVLLWLPLTFNEAGIC